MSDLITLSTGEVLDVSAWPLPEGVVDDGTPLNRRELAELLGKSENTITSWLSKGLPVHAGGSNGVAYEFLLTHCWAWKQSRDAADLANKNRREEWKNQAALIFRNLDPDQEEEQRNLTAAEVRSWAEAEYARNRLAEQRGDLVRADRVRAVMEQVLLKTGNTLDAFVDFLEIQFGLTADQVQKVESRTDGLRLELRSEIEEILQRPGSVVSLSGGQSEMAV